MSIVFLVVPAALRAGEPDACAKLHGFYSKSYLEGDILGDLADMVPSRANKTKLMGLRASLPQSRDALLAAFGKNKADIAATELEEGEASGKLMYAGEASTAVFPEALKRELFRRLVGSEDCLDGIDGYVPLSSEVVPSSIGAKQCEGVFQGKARYSYAPYGRPIVKSSSPEISLDDLIKKSRSLLDTEPSSPSRDMLLARIKNVEMAEKYFACLSVMTKSSGRPITYDDNITIRRFACRESEKAFSEAFNGWATAMAPYKEKARATGERAEYAHKSSKELSSGLECVTIRSRQINDSLGVYYVPSTVVADPSTNAPPACCTTGAALVNN